MGELDDHQAMALSASADGFVNAYCLRPPVRVVRTFRFPGGAPVGQARFGARAPASIVASAHGGHHVCVWALQGYLLASIDVGTGAPLKELSVVSENDAREGVLCSVGDGTVHMLSLPYLLPVWTHACGDGSGIVPTVLERNPERSLLWVGLEDGSFEAIVAEEDGSFAVSADGAGDTIGQLNRADEV